MHPRPHPPVLLVIAVFSRHEAAFDWVRPHLEQFYGPVALTSPLYTFNQTAYYASTMGTPLHKGFMVFRDLISADRLPEIKLQTNDLENQLAAASLYSEPRPINLDPGYLTLGKFLLATTKDQAHRIFLREGIFAEVTLRFEEGTFRPWPWTYADYRQEEVLQFLRQARNFYRQRLREEAAASLRLVESVVPGTLKGNGEEKTTARSEES